MVTERVLIDVSSKGIPTVTSGLRSIGTTSRGAAAGVAVLVAALAAVAAGLAARAFIQASDRFLTIKNAISDATSATGDFQGVLDELRKISRESATSIEDNAKGFQKLSQATETFGTSNQGVLDILAGVNAAVRLSGGESEDAAGAVDKLSKSLSDGRLSGDEFLRFLQPFPQLAQAAAAALGTTVAGLTDLNDQGRLGSDQTLPALQAALASLRGDLEGVEFTTAETVQIFKNEFALVLGEISNSLGGTSGLNDLILKLASSLRVAIPTAIRIAVPFFTTFVRVALAAAESVADVVNAGRGLLGTINEFRIARLRNSLNPELQKQGAFAGEAGRQQLEANRKELARLEAVQAELGAAYADSDSKFAAFLNSINEGLADIDRVGVALGKAADNAQRLGGAGESPSNAGRQADAVGPSSDELKARQKEALAFQKIISDLNEEAAKQAKEELRDRQNEAKAFQDVIAGIRQESERQKQEEEAAAQSLAEIQTQINREAAATRGQRQLAIFDLEQEIARARELASLAGQDPGTNTVVTQLETQLAQLKARTDIGDSLGASITGALSTAFTNSIESGQNLSDALGDAFQQAANRSLTEGFDESLKTLQTGLSQAIDAGANAITSTLPPAFQGAAGAFGSALTSAIGFLAQQGLAALFGGGGNSQSSSSRGVRSAVTSSQAVRGVVAGPSSIAIAQVGDNLSDAVAPLVAQSQELNGLVRRIVDIAERMRLSSSGVASDAFTIATQSAPLAAS